MEESAMINGTLERVNRDCEGRATFYPLSDLSIYLIPDMKEYLIMPNLNDYLIMRNARVHISHS